MVDWRKLSRIELVEYANIWREKVNNDLFSCTYLNMNMSYWSGFRASNCAVNCLVVPQHKPSNPWFTRETKQRRRSDTGNFVGFRWWISHEQWKKGPWFLVGWVIYGINYTTQLYRDYFINHEIRIPSLTNQYFPWKVVRPFCFFVAHRFFFSKSPLDPRLRKWRSLKIRTANEESGAIGTRGVTRGSFENHKGTSTFQGVPNKP